MSSEFQGPIINKRRGGLGRTSSENKDAIKGLVAGAVAVMGKFALGTIYKLIQLSDAEDLGLNAAYDSTNKILFYEHIKRFFEYAPEGTLYILGAPQGTTLAHMCDKTLAYAYKLATDESTNSEITRIGVVLNPDDDYEPTFTTGLDADVIAAILKAQEMSVDLFDRAIRFDGIIIEGRLNTAAAISTLPIVRSEASEYATVVIGQDPTIAALDAAYSNYADVGSLLGMNAVRKVSECLGSVDIANKPESKKGNETYPLTNASKSFYLSASISNGKKFSALTVAEQTALGTKGYVYIGKYQGLDGFYFSDSHTCIDITDDYAYMEDNQVFGKAAQLVRRALLPLQKGTIELDPNTGFILASVAAFYEAKAQNSTKSMASASEISGLAQVVLLPNQDVAGTSTINLTVSYVRQGILRIIKADIGATNPAASA